MKLLQNLFFVFILAIGGCIEVPEYSKTPSISFNSVFFRDETPIDYIYLTINYKDGDGDLGLSNSDLKIDPFKEFIDSVGVSVVNPNHYNIFPVLYRKVGEQYLPSLVTGYNGIFPRLRDDGRKGPIEGSIQYKLGSVNFFNEDSSIAKIRVYIQDRALNKSNVIETPPFTVIYK